MAPGYRTNAQTRRGARAGYPEHDDFEGLPVRQWRKQWVSVAPPPEMEEHKKKDRWAEELPHGMPKDSDLLPPHSLALLRAARSGCLRKRPAPADDEDGDAEALPGDKIEKKASAMDEGFRVRMWKQVPRSEEGSTISYLAKRHKNTITLPSKALATQTAGPTVTKATVRRIDAAGNPYTQEVTVTDGQQVDGEIISTSVVPAPEQTGQGPPAAATPTRRKPPIPQKKKGRGRGRGARGRGRVLPLQASSRPGPQDGPAIDGENELKGEGLGPDGIKIENDDGKAIQDVDMRDSSAVDDDGDEGEGDGDEVDDDEGDESGTPVENEDQEMDDAPALADASGASSNLAPPTPNPLNTETSRIEGSPLKNVLIRSPIDASPQIPPITAQTSTDVGSSGVPDESTRGLQPSPMTSQLPEGPISEMIEETPAEEVKATEAATPEKTIPESDALEPATTEPAAPEITSPEPIASEPAVSEPVAQEPVDPEPAVPEPAVPEPVALEPTAPETAAPEPAAPEPAASEPAVPETAAPETTASETVALETTAPETAETVPEETMGVVAITLTQDAEEPAAPLLGPPSVSPAAIEQPPSVGDAPQAEPSTADIPIPTSEDPQTGEAPEADHAVVEPEASPAEPAPAETTMSAPASDPALVESAPIARAITEDGNDDGSDLLGPLGASLSRQAEEDVPLPTSAPANPETEQSSKTDPVEQEAMPGGTPGGD